MMTHAFSIKIAPDHSNTIFKPSVVTNEHSGFSLDSFGNPIDKIGDAINDRIYETASAIYIALKQLFIDLLHFMFVDLLGKLSLLAVILGCLAFILNSKRASWRLLKGGAVGAIISSVAAWGWTA